MEDEEKQTAAATKEAQLAEDSVRIAREKEEAEADLAAAIPALEEAAEALKNINKDDITNLKSLKGPKMRIVLREDVEVIPNYVNGSRATLYNLLEEANKELRSYLHKAYRCKC